MSDVEFSRRLRKQMGHRDHRVHHRAVAVALTCGEVVAAFICFGRYDFIGGYALVSYLIKEWVLIRE